MTGIKKQKCMLWKIISGLPNYQEVPDLHKVEVRRCQLTTVSVSTMASMPVICRAVSVSQTDSWKLAVSHAANSSAHAQRWLAATAVVHTAARPITVCPSLFNQWTWSSTATIESRNFIRSRTLARLYVTSNADHRLVDKKYLTSAFRKDYSIVICDLVWVGMWVNQRFGRTVFTCLQEERCNVSGG